MTKKKTIKVSSPDDIEIVGDGTPECIKGLADEMVDSIRPEEITDEVFVELANRLKPASGETDPDQDTVAPDPGHLSPIEQRFGRPNLSDRDIIHLPPSNMAYDPNIPLDRYIPQSVFDKYSDKVDVIINYEVVQDDKQIIKMYDVPDDGRRYRYVTYFQELRDEVLIMCTVVFPLEFNIKPPATASRGHKWLFDPEHGINYAFNEIVGRSGTISNIISDIVSAPRNEDHIDYVRDLIVKASETKINGGDFVEEGARFDRLMSSALQIVYDLHEPQIVDTDLSKEEIVNDSGPTKSWCGYMCLTKDMQDYIDHEVGKMDDVFTYYWALADRDDEDAIDYLVNRLMDAALMGSWQTSIRKCLHALIITDNTLVDLVRRAAPTYYQYCMNLVLKDFERGDAQTRAQLWTDCYRSPDSKVKADARNKQRDLERISEDPTILSDPENIPPEWITYCMQRSLGRTALDAAQLGYAYIRSELETAANSQSRLLDESNDHIAVRHGLIPCLDRTGNLDRLIMRMVDMSQYKPALIMPYMPIETAELTVIGSYVLKELVNPSVPGHRLKEESKKDIPVVTYVNAQGQTVTRRMTESERVQAEQDGITIDSTTCRIWTGEIEHDTNKTNDNLTSKKYAGRNKIKFVFGDGWVGIPTGPRQWTKKTKQVYDVLWSLYKASPAVGQALIDLKKTPDLSVFPQAVPMSRYAICEKYRPRSVMVSETKNGKSSTKRISPASGDTDAKLWSDILDQIDIILHTTFDMHYDRDFIEMSKKYTGYDPSLLKQDKVPALIASVNSSIPKRKQGTHHETIDGLIVLSFPILGLSAMMSGQETKIPLSDLNTSKSYIEHIKKVNPARSAVKGRDFTPIRATPDNYSDQVIYTATEHVHAYLNNHKTTDNWSTYRYWEDIIIPIVGPKTDSIIVLSQAHKSKDAVTIDGTKYFKHWVDDTNHHDIIVGGKTRSVLIEDAVAYRSGLRDTTLDDIDYETQLKIKSDYVNQLNRLYNVYGVQYDFIHTAKPKSTTGSASLGRTKHWYGVKFLYIEDKDRVGVRPKGPRNASLDDFNKSS